jgi:1-acyl-sn-glycerol-3-phosphate acyltransferase
MKLYHIVRPIVTLAYKFYFKKIYYSGGEKIPLGKPLIVSVNHPTGFFEPTLLACVFWECDFHFITRGDVFVKPFYRKILEQLNMIPIFRFKDGFANLKNNAATMEYVNQALVNNQQIMIFTEGTTETVKRLRPLQKGFSRMAFGSYEANGDIGLHIVPICLTYSDPHTPRSEVYIQVGDAIPLSRYYDLHRQNPTRAVTVLTQDMEARMRPNLIHIAHEQDDRWVEKVLYLYRNSFPEPVFPIFKNAKRRLLAQQEIVNNINEMADNQKYTLEKNIESYFLKLNKENISDVAIAQPYHANLKNLIILILGFIPYIIGWYGHWLPNWYARKVRKERVKSLEFEGPVQAGVAMGSTIIQYLLLFIVALIVNKLWFWALLTLMPFFGFYALNYHELWQKYKACSALKRLSTEGGIKLQAEREAILKTVRKV